MPEPSDNGPDGVTLLLISLFFSVAFLAFVIVIGNFVVQPIMDRFFDADPLTCAESANTLAEMEERSREVNEDIPEDNRQEYLLRGAESMEPEDRIENMNYMYLRGVEPFAEQPTEITAANFVAAYDELTVLMHEKIAIAKQEMQICRKGTISKADADDIEEAVEEAGDVSGTYSHVTRNIYYAVQEAEDRAREEARRIERGW